MTTTTFVLLLSAFCVVITSSSSSSSSVSAVNVHGNVNVNVNATGYCTNNNNAMDSNNSCLCYGEEKEYKYLHAVEELRRKASAEEVEEKAKSELWGYDSELDDCDDEGEGEYDNEDNEDWEQVEEDYEDDYEWGQEEDGEEFDEEEHEYTAEGEELELMERFYVKYRSILSEELGEDFEEYELGNMEVVYERYLEWKNNTTEEDVEAEEVEEEIDIEGREQDIHEALIQRRHQELGPSSTPSSSADNESLRVEYECYHYLNDDEEDYKASSSITETMNLPSYTKIPAMITVITISDTPISLLLKPNNNNVDNEQQQQQDDGNDLFEKIVRIYWSIMFAITMGILIIIL